MDKNFRHLANMKNFWTPPAMSIEEFNKRLLNFENKSFHLMENLSPNQSSHNDQSVIYFNNLEWNKKVHPGLELNDLMDCISMIIDYYEDLKYSAKINS